MRLFSQENDISTSEAIKKKIIKKEVIVKEQKNLNE